MVDRLGILMLSGPGQLMVGAMLREGELSPVEILDFLLAEPNDDEGKLIEIFETFGIRTIRMGLDNDDTFPSRAEIRRALVPPRHFRDLEYPHSSRKGQLKRAGEKRR